MLILAVGVAVNTAIFGVVNGVLFRRLPCPDARHIVRIWQTHDEWTDSEVALLRYFAVHMPASYSGSKVWAEQNQAFESLASYNDGTYALTTPDGSEEIETTEFTGRPFDVLGVQPILGRAFLPEEDEAGGGPVDVG